MNPEIKQRIEQLKNGEIPKGFKKTDFGVFPCDWVTDKTLGDLFDFYGGLSKSRDELGDEGYAYLHYGDLHRGSFNSVSIDQYELLPKCDISLTGKEKCLMKDGDVAFLDASEDLEGTSRAVLIDNPDNKPFIAGLHIIYGKAKNNSLDKWFKQYLTSSDSVKKQFQRLAVGYKVYGVNKDTLPRIRVAYPSSAQEQSRIAEFLMKWDKAIDLYDKQIEALTRYKKICLRKMFPQKGQHVPEWRFHGFSDPWEYYKLGQIAKFINGRAYSQPELLSEGKYRVLRVGNFYTSDSWYYSNLELGEKYYANYGDLLYTWSATFGPHIWLGEKVIYHYHIWKIELSEYLEKSFALQLLEQDKTNILSGKNGTTMIHITKEGMEDKNIIIPSALEEQKLIGTFFERLDYLINLYQRKREIIISQRRSLQQFLLNGIVRV